MLSFIRDMFKIGFIALLQILIAFGIGTTATAIVLWYYDGPLFVSIVGGIVTLGLALAFQSDTLFD